MAYSIFFRYAKVGAVTYNGDTLFYGCELSDFVLKNGSTELYNSTRDASTYKYYILHHHNGSVSGSNTFRAGPITDMGSSLSVDSQPTSIGSFSYYSAHVNTGQVVMPESYSAHGYGTMTGYAIYRLNVTNGSYDSVFSLVFWSPTTDDSSSTVPGAYATKVDLSSTSSSAVESVDYVCMVTDVSASSGSSSPATEGYFGAGSSVTPHDVVTVMDIDSGSGGSSGISEGSLYQIQVFAQGATPPVNLLDHGSVTRTYDGNSIICKVYDTEHDSFSSVFTYQWIVRDSETQQILFQATSNTLHFTNVTSTVDVSAYYNGSFIDPVKITINPISIPVSLKNDAVISKYYDDRDGEGTRAIVTNDMFDYDFSNVLIEDKTSSTTLAVGRLGIIPSATYASAGSSSTTTTVGVTFSFTTVGSQARNYVVTPDNTFNGKTGTIRAKANGKTANESGYSIGIFPRTSISENTYAYRQDGYSAWVIKNGQSVNVDNYECNWVCDYTKNNETTRSLVSPYSAPLNDAGDYDLTVYVKGKSSTDDYYDGYVYVGQISATILPVIDVSWIAVSY